jgi:hypothetical protein
MNLISRNKDCIDNLSNNEKLYKIKKFPIFMGTVKSPKKKDLLADMQFIINKSNGMIQLSNLIPLKILYKNTHTPGTIGKIWEQHHSEFAKFILSTNVKNIIEIGGSNGILAEKVTKKKQIKWLIVDPDASCKNKKIKLKKKFFDKKINLSFKNKDVVHSHTLEHIYYPDEFLKQLSDKMDLGKKMFISVPNIKQMLKKKYTNALNFEHTYYLDQKIIKYLLEKNGFKILRKEFFRSDHSIFYETKKVLKKKNSPLKNQYKENKKLFLNFINFYKNEVRKLNKKISKKKSVYLFGAHIFSQFLLSFGLKDKNIKYIIDNDKKKHEKRLYGTNKYVKSTSVLKSERDPIIILRAGVYNDEIKSDITKNINKNAIFI